MIQKIEMPIEEIIEKRKRGVTLEHLAQEYGFSLTSICRRINEYYKEKGEEKPYFKIKRVNFKIELPIEEIIEERKKGKTLKDLAQEYGVSPTLISNRINKYYEKKGEKKPDFKVKYKKELPIEEIIEKRKRGIALSELEQEYGSSSTLIVYRMNEYYKEKGEEKPDFKVKRKKELPIEEIIEKIKRGLNRNDLAQEYGVSPTLISKRINEYYEKKGEKKPDFKVKCKKELPVEEIIEKRKRGVTQKDLAEEYGVSRTLIRKRINEYYERKGEEKSNLRKVKNELPIEEIIEKREKGINAKELAQEYGVSGFTIRKRINEYYNSGEIKKYKVLKSDSILVQYLEKGLTPEQIQEVAQNSEVIIPQSLMDSAMLKVKGQKTIQSEERDK